MVQAERRINQNIAISPSGRSKDILILEARAC
jgi:hypothetical protein